MVSARFFYGAIGDDLFLNTHNMYMNYKVKLYYNTNKTPHLVGGHVSDISDADSIRKFRYSWSKSVWKENVNKFK